MNVMLAVFGLGGMEVVLILAVVLLLFGAKRLPELARGLGSSIKEFKKATSDVTEEIRNAGDPHTSPQPKLTAASQTQPQSTVAQTSSTPKA